MTITFVVGFIAGISFVLAIFGVCVGYLIATENNEVPEPLPEYLKKGSGEP